MFSNVVAAAIGGTRSLARLDELSQDIWKAWGSGQLSDLEAGQLAGKIEDQRRLVRPQDTVAARAPDVPRAFSIFGPKRRPRSPDRVRSMERRRGLAASGALPRSLALRYTTGEQAVLAVVADAVREHKECAMTVGEIAARAGVCMTLARNAIRLAAADGLLTIQERRRKGAKNLPNVVRIINSEWLAWMARRSKPIASRNLGPTPTQFRDNRDKPLPFPSAQSLSRVQRRDWASSGGRGDVSRA